MVRDKNGTPDGRSRGAFSIIQKGVLVPRRVDILENRVRNLRKVARSFD